jgi:ABC-2 type transport system permease protein
MTSRIVTQIRRDHRSVGLLLVVPMIVMGLLGYILRLDRGPLDVGLVIQDEGVVLPNGTQFSVAGLLDSALDERQDLALHELELEVAERQLRNGELELVLVLPAGLSQALTQGRAAQLELIVEGSNPSQSEALPAQIGAAVGQELASLRASGSAPAIGFETRYLYAGEEYDFLDSFAPVYIAFFTFFFVFLLTGVSFLRERTQGTIERLLATPITRIEIVLGYMMGFGIFALIQSSVFLFFTILVLRIRYVGELGLVFLLLGLVAVGAVNLGIFLSTFARTELQVVQFIPIVIVPQALLSGLLVPVEQLPQLLRIAAHGMPLTYANQAMTDVMIRGFGFTQVAGDLGILLAFAVIALVLSATTLRRQFI